MSLQKQVRKVLCCREAPVSLLSLKNSLDLQFIELTFSVLMQEGELFKDIGLFPGTCSLHLRGNAVPVVTSLVLMD